ncbi:uncharacterized protein LOC111863799 isoform X6 [Cryptotermes secundus]|uniref:uncharacterized protein LOC111863799 isoform X6 n=1 Tax=Cryptotermes secundus TaxID=105785 RepID=UPI001454E388|nr:uncharacterized protein LOC111863799 isoform X6 [Cryptotermes secundus]
MCDVCKHFGIGPQPYEGDFQGCWILSHPCTVEERRLSAGAAVRGAATREPGNDTSCLHKLGTWKQVTVRRLISRGATEGKHVNWTELQIVPGTIVPYARTDRGEPRKTSFIQVAWRRTNSRSCRHTLRELNLRVSRLKTCSFVEADALLRPCVSSSAPPGAVQVWKRNLQGNTRCRTAWHLEL